MSSPPPTPRDRLETWGRVCVTTFGGLGAMVLFTTRASIAAGQLLEPAAVALLVAVGVAEGALLGVLQWTAIRRFLDPDDRTEWVVATALGVGLAWLIALGVGAGAPRALDLGSAWVDAAALLGGGAVGAMIGGAQAWVLSRRYTGLARWVAWSAVGWSLAVVPVLASAPSLLAGRSVGADALTAILVGLLAAGLGAVVIGTALEALLRRPRPDVAAHASAPIPRALKRREEAPAPNPQIQWEAVAQLAPAGAARAEARAEVRRPQPPVSGAASLAADLGLGAPVDRTAARADDRTAARADDRAPARSSAKASARTTAARPPEPPTEGAEPAGPPSTRPAARGARAARPEPTPATRAAPPSSSPARPAPQAPAPQAPAPQAPAGQAPARGARAARPEPTPATRAAPPSSGPAPSAKPPPRGAR